MYLKYCPTLVLGYSSTKFEIDKSKFAQVSQIGANFQKIQNVKKFKRFNRFWRNSCICMSYLCAVLGR